MTGEGLWFLQFHSTIIVEATLPGAKNLGGDECGNSAGHVDDATTGKVDHANSKEWVDIPWAQEAIVGPDGMNDDRIHKARQHHRVAQIRCHLTTLGQRTSDDRGRCRSKGKLEQPKHVVIDAHQEEVGISDEGGLTTRLRSAVGECVADRVESEGGATGVQQIFEHGILDVLLLDGTGTKHGEAGLHEEDERRRIHEEERVDSAGDLATDACYELNSPFLLGERLID